MSTQIEINKQLVKYIQTIGYRQDPIIDELVIETKALGNVAQMQIAPEQGQLLKIIITIAKAKKCLEIGRFTGLSTLCMAKGLPDDGKIITTDSPKKLTQSHGMSGLEIILSSSSDNLEMDSWSYKKFDGKIHVDTSQPEKDMAKIISQIVSQGCAIENVRIYRSSLEDVFMKLTGKSLQVASDSIETKENLLDV